MSTTNIMRRLWQKLVQETHDGDRNLYESFGYPGVPTLKHFWDMYHRNDIASRIIRAFPQATWRHRPCIRDEKGRSSEESDFVNAWETLTDKHSIYHYFERTDLMSGIGEFAVLFVGLRDGLAPDEPYEPGNHELLYLQPYSQSDVTVSEWDIDAKSPRFGLPDYYTLQTGSSSLRTSKQSRSIRVHHSRVIHVAEHIDRDEVFGIPRLLPVFNRMLDLEKVVGGSAEMFWLLGNRGLALNVDSDAEVQDKEAIEEQLDEYYHNIRRHLLLQGIQATPLASSAPSPKDNVEVLLKIISGAVGIPQRILTGSEQGELASSQDEGNWLARIDERRQNFAAIAIIKPFVELMIASGNMPEPKGRSGDNPGWWVEWDEIAGMTEKEKADIASSRSNILRNYLSTPGSEFVVPVQEFRSEWLGLEPESEYDLPSEPDPLDEDDEQVSEQFTPGGNVET